MTLEVQGLKQNMIWAPIANFEKALNMSWEQIKEIWHSFCPPTQAQTVILNFLT